MAFKAEEGMSTATSVSAGSIKILGRRRKEKAVLEKGVMLGCGEIQMYTYRKGSRTIGCSTQEGLQVPVHVESHFDLFG